MTREALRTLALLLPVFLLSPPARAGEEAPEDPAPHETAIPVPAPNPSGLTVAWKPTVLTVRLDTGKGEQFGSDKLQPLRFLGRYTFLAKEGAPLFVRAEVEGGTFQTETEARGIGSKGYDVAGRLTLGAAAWLSPGVLFAASVGLISRYDHGAATGGSPTIGTFGALASTEIDWRIYPFITLSGALEAAVIPFPYGADANLGDLSDGSEVRARVQVSFDLSRVTALEIGYDFTRWHNTFVSSTILGNPKPDAALIFEDREYALTLGLRFKM